MRSAALFLGALVGVFVAAFGYTQACRLEELASENERLRLFNAREARRYQKPGANVNYSACAEARHLLGTPPHLVAAVFRQENGPPDIETGVLGKTDWVSKHYPVKDWAALETGRTLNIYAWDYIMHHPDVLKKVLKHASKPYTGNTLPEAWVKNIMTFQAEEAKKMERAQ